MARPAKLRKKTVGKSVYWFTKAGGDTYFGTVQDVPYKEARKLFAAHVQSLSDEQKDNKSRAQTAGDLMDVEQRRQVHRLLAVDVGKHADLYPCWQFTDNNVLAGVAKVLPVLRDFTPWTQLSIFLGGNHRLAGATPLQALRQGKVDAVRRAARAYGEQGAG